MAPWLYPVLYVAIGAVFSGWATMTMDDEEGTLSKGWLMAVLLWPLLVLMLVGALLGRR